MRLQQETVANVVKGWRILFPYPKTDAELVFFSGKLFKSIQNAFSNEAFLIAAEMIEDQHTEFPTIAHVKSLQNVVAEKIGREVEQSAKLLPEETTNLTDDEIAKNLKKISIIAKLLSKEISLEDSIKQQEELVTYAK